MKLLYCYDCGDIFNLQRYEKECRCGMVKGGYINSSDAITNGKGVSIAIGNGSFQSALYELYKIGDELNRDDYIKMCRVDYCWVRPHEGSGNPHSKVEGEDE